MPTVRLHVADLALRMTLKTMLEAEGCTVDDVPGAVMLTDDPKAAVARLVEGPALVLSTVQGLPAAIDAMKQGVYGYVLLPLQPGELPLMVNRAASQGKSATGNQRERVDVATLAEVERMHIQSVLRLSKHNQAKAARALGIGRNTLWRKLKQFQIEDNEADDS